MITPVNPAYLKRRKKRVKVCIKRAEVDEFWSFVGSKKQQRWTWYAIDQDTGQIIAFVLGPRTDDTFKKLLRLLKRAGIRVKQWFCDEWGAYRRCLPARKLFIGKENTWQIERKNLDFRTRIKRLQRRTLCFSKKVAMHDTIIGLFINIVFFNCKLI